MSIKMPATIRAIQPFLLILILLSADVLAKRDFEISFENCSCVNMDPHILTALNCGLSRNIRRRTFFMEWKFKKNISQFSMKLQIVLPRKPTDFVLVNLTSMDGCQFLSSQMQMPFLKLTRENAKKFSNMPKECPFLKDKLYYMRGFRFNRGLMPGFLFESDKHIWFELWTENKAMMQVYIKNHITRRAENSWDTRI